MEEQLYKDFIEYWNLEEKFDSFKESYGKPKVNYKYEFTLMTGDADGDLTSIFILDEEERKAAVKWTEENEDGDFRYGNEENLWGEIPFSILEKIFKKTGSYFSTEVDHGYSTLRMSKTSEEPGFWEDGLRIEDRLYEFEEGEDD